MLNNLFNELGYQYDIDTSTMDNLEACSFKFENNVELYVYVSEDKRIIHLSSVVHNINAGDDKLALFEYLLKFQLMGVKSHHNAFGLSHDGHTIYIYRNFDASSIRPEQFVQGVKSLATMCNSSREQLQQLHIEPSTHKMPLTYHCI